MVLKKILMQYLEINWRGGRAVEGARLESVYAGDCIVGSNPIPSAIHKSNQLMMDLY